MYLLFIVSAFKIEEAGVSNMIIDSMHLVEARVLLELCIFQLTIIIHRYIV